MKALPPEKAAEALALLRRFERGILALGNRIAPLSDPDDILQEAALAILEAARDHDPGRASLSTLAWPRIRRRIQRMGARDRLIPLPDRVRQAIGWSGEAQPEALLPLSLSLLEGEEEGGKVLPEPAAADGDPARLVEEQDLRERLAAALAALPPEERRMLALCFEEGRSLREAAREMGLTDSRARTLRRRALCRLRALVEGENPPKRRRKK